MFVLGILFFLLYLVNFSPIMPPVFQIDFLQKVSKFEWIPCKYKKCGSDYTPIITPVRLSGFRRTQNVDSGQTIDQSIVFYRALVSFRPLVKINPLFIRQKADFIAKTTQRQMRTQKCAERTERWLMVLNLPLCYWSWIKKKAVFLLSMKWSGHSRPQYLAFCPHFPPWPSFAEELWGRDLWSNRILDLCAQSIVVGLSFLNLPNFGKLHAHYVDRR